MNEMRLVLVESELRRKRKNRKQHAGCRRQDGFTGNRKERAGTQRTKASRERMLTCHATALKVEEVNKKNKKAKKA